MKLEKLLNLETDYKVIDAQASASGEAWGLVAQRHGLDLGGVLVQVVISMAILRVYEATLAHADSQRPDNDEHKAYHQGRLSMLRDLLGDG